MANFILIAGTYHGGWGYDPVIPGLEAAGHRVFAPTLTGLDPNNPPTTAVNLDTHINDVIEIIEKNKLDEVTLVGASYGGMVITGVVGKTAAKITKMIYLDGQLPFPGEREWDLIPEHEHEGFIDLCTDGIYLHPDPGFMSYEPRMQPHPFATKLQPIHYDQVLFDSLDKVFVFAEKWFHDPSVTSPLLKSYNRAKSGTGWTTHSWPFGHDLVREASKEVLELLIDCAT